MYMIIPTSSTLFMTTAWQMKAADAKAFVEWMQQMRVMGQCSSVDRQLELVLGSGDIAISAP
jgi:hypothetical protein